MGRIGLRRDLLTVLLIAFVIATLASLPLFDRLHGLSIDVLTWLRWRTVGQLHDPAKSPTTVVALDEETYRRKPFAGTPSITWTPAMAKALTEVVDAGAKVVG
jgi:adenylate cyclase